MPRRRQRFSQPFVPGHRRGCHAAKTRSSHGSYTQKEYLADEKQRLLELVARHSDDWNTIARLYNAESSRHGRKRTEEGLKNKHSRMKKEEEEEEMRRFLTNRGSLALDGWGGASTAPSQGLQSALGDQMSAFESEPSSSSGLVDLAAQTWMSYVGQALDSGYAGCSSSDFSSSPLNLSPTPYAFMDVARPGYGLESLDSMCSGSSAADFPSSLTELRPSSSDPIWPSTLANAPTLGGGLDSLCVGWVSDGSTSFPPDSY